MSSIEAEFDEAKSRDEEISTDDHIAFIESIQKLAETLISCTVGVFETRQEENRIASVALVKMLSQLFMTGHQACENRLKYKWTKESTKEIEEKIHVYKQLSNAVLDEQQQYFEEPQVQLEEDVGKLIKQIQPIIDIKQEPEIIEISDDEEKPVAPAKKKPKIMSISRRNGNNLNSVTEGCQNDETVTPVLSRLLNAPSVIRLIPETCLTYSTGVTVGYSDAGKKPILIVSDPRLKENVYTYRSMIKGSYRCTSCGLLNVHRYAKLYQGVLYANVHESTITCSSILQCSITVIV
uniref:Non-structural maintenance of chromosomes element 4 n=1 Tax=Panagrolaimus superbus TaxID=310955 RepID=A0A914YRP1_9BILA